MLGLVGQPRRAVLHPGDLRIGIGRALPVRVRKLLALALAIEPDKVLRRRRINAAFLGHPRQHLAIGLAIVAAHDRAQRRIGLHGRTVHADPLGLHEIMAGDERQNPAEDLVVHLVRQTAAGLGHPTVIRHLLPRRQPQKLPQRQRIRAAPDNPALAVDAFEIADQQHPKISTRRHRRRPHPRRVIRLAVVLHEPVEPGIDQQLLELVVKRVPWRPRHIRPGHDQIRLNLTVPRHRHRHIPRAFDALSESGEPDFVNTLLILLRHK